jgi:Flp pilus assembly protein TadD
MADLVATSIYAGRTAQALALARQATVLDPTFFFPTLLEGTAAVLAGDYPTAIAKYQQAIAMGAPPFATALLAYAQGISGDRTAALATLRELNAMSPDGKAVPFNLALVSLGLGDYPRTLDHLEQAYAANSQFLVWLKSDPLYDPLREEPRFKALMKRLNFEK